MTKKIYLNLLNNLENFNNIENKTDKDYHNLNSILLNYFNISFTNKEIDDLVKSILSNQDITIQNLDISKTINLLNDSKSIYNLFITSDKEIKETFKNIPELNEMISDIKEWQQNEFFLFISTYFKNSFRSDFQKGLYSDFLTIANNKIILKSNSNENIKNFYKTVINRINEQSISLKNIKATKFVIKHKNNAFYGKEILFSDNVLYIDKKPFYNAYLLNNKIKFGKSFINIENAEKENGSFTVFENTLNLGKKVSSAKKGQSDLLLFNDSLNKILSADTTISNKAEIETDSQIRHYVNGLSFLYTKIEGKTIQQHLKENKFSTESFKNLIGKDLSLIEKIQSSSHFHKLILILYEGIKHNQEFKEIKNIKINEKSINNIEEIFDIKKIENVEINNKEIKEIDLNELTLNELKIKTEDQYEYTYRFKKFKSLIDNTLFLMSSMSFSKTIGENLKSNMSIESFKQFYKSINIETIDKGLIQELEIKSILNVLEFIEDIINNKKSDSDIKDFIKNIDRFEDFSKVFLVVVEDIISRKLFNLNEKEISKIKNTFKSINKLNSDIDYSFYKLEDFSKKSFEELIEIILNNNLAKEDLLNLNIEEEDLDFLEDYLSKLDKVKNKKRVINAIIDIFKDYDKKLLIEIIQKNELNKDKKIVEKEQILKFLKQDIYYVYREDFFFKNIEQIIEGIDNKSLDISGFEFYSEEYFRNMYKTFLELKNIKENRLKNIRNKIVYEEINKFQAIKDYLKTKYSKLSELISDNYINQLIEETFNGSVDKAFSEIILKTSFKLNEYSLKGSLDISYKIEDAIKDNKQIVFFVDNDADGSSAYAAIENFKRFSNYDNIKIFYTKDTKEVRGLNYEQVKNLKEQLSDNILMITADNATSNISEFEKIKSLFNDFELIITDHHPFENEEMYNYYLDNKEWLGLLNARYDLTEDKLIENKFNVSGCETIATVLDHLIEDSNYKDISDKIKSISNYLDLVSIEDSDITDANVLQQMSSQINSAITIENYSKSSLSLSPELNKRIDYLNKKSSMLLDSFKNNDLDNIKDRLFNLDNNINVKLNNFNKIVYLRYIYIYLYAKDSQRTKEENIFYEELKKTMFELKALDKDMIDYVRKEYKDTEETFKEDIYKNLSFEYGDFQIFKNDGMGNKFYRKVFPVSNKGFLINGSFDGNKFSGSFRGSFSYEEIFGELMNEYNFKIKGQPNAAGFKIEVPEGVDKYSYISEILNKASDKIKDLKALQKKEKVLVSIEDLYEVNKLENELKSATNMKNLKREYLVSYEDLNNYAATKDVKNLSLKDIKDLNTEGYLRMQFAFDNSLNLILKENDIKDLKPGSFLKVKQMSEGVFISEGIETKLDLNTLKTENKRESMSSYQLENFKNKYSKDNNYTIEISPKDFIKRNNLNGLPDIEIKEYFEDIKNLLESTNSEMKVVLDIEGIGFGRNTKMFNYGSFNFELCKECEYGLRITNTSLLIDINEVLTASIQNLTGIKNEDLKENGLTPEKIDKILTELYKDKKIIFQAHNIAYDYNGIVANLPNFAEIMKNNLKLDSAIYSRHLKLATDSNNSYQRLSLNNGDKNIELGNFYNYSNVSINSFLRNSEIGSIFNNKSGTTTLKWILKNGSKVLEIKTEKETYFINEYELSSMINKKEIKLGTKYSVQEILKQNYVKILRNDILTEITDQEKTYQENMKSFLIKEIPDMRSYINSINDFEDLDMSNEILLQEYIDKFLERNFENLRDRLLSSTELLKKINSERKNMNDNELEKIEKFKESFENKKKELRENKKILINKIKEINIISNGITIESDILFSDSHEIKAILNKYDSNLSIEDNLKNIINTVNFNSSKIEVVLKKIKEIDLKYKNGKLNNFDINPELLKVGIDFHKNFRELHNNIEENFSDVSYESIIMLLAKKKYELYKKEGFIDYIGEAILNTEKNMSILDSTSDFKHDNGFTARQLIERGKKERYKSSMTLNSKELKEKEVNIKTGVEYDLLSDSFNSLIDLIEYRISIDKIENSIKPMIKSVLVFLEKKNNLGEINFEVRLKSNMISKQTMDDSINSFRRLNFIELENILNDYKETLNDKRSIDSLNKIISNIKDIRFYIKNKSKINEIKTRFDKEINLNKDFFISRKNNQYLKKHLDFIKNMDKLNLSTYEEFKEYFNKNIKRYYLNISEEGQKDFYLKVIKSFIDKTAIINNSLYSAFFKKLYNEELIFTFNKSENIIEKYNSGLTDKMCEISQYDNSFLYNQDIQEILKVLNSEVILKSELNKMVFKSELNNKEDKKKTF